MNTFMDKIKNNRPALIAFLGDSVTQGCFETIMTREGTFDTRYRPEDGYPRKLKEILSYLYPKASVNILNFGVSGNTVGMGLARVEEMLHYRPDLVVVCFGLNDVVRGREGLEEYGDNLREIMKKLRGTDTLFMTPNRIADRIDEWTTDPDILQVMEEIAGLQNNGILHAYMEYAKRICAEEGIPVCDCYAVWEKLRECGVDTTELLANGINHPAEKMHWLFAVELCRTLLKING